MNERTPRDQKLRREINKFTARSLEILEEPAPWRPHFAAIAVVISSLALFGRSLHALRHAE